MLTETQLKNLEPLTKHSKYGKLLSDAIEIWKTEIDPELSSLDPDEETGIYEICKCEDGDQDVNKSSLIIAALLKKPVIKGWLFKPYRDYFNISKSEIQTMSWSFEYGEQMEYYDEVDDGKGNGIPPKSVRDDPDSLTEAAKFGQAVNFAIGFVNL